MINKENIKQLLEEKDVSVLQDTDIENLVIEVRLCDNLVSV